MKFRSITLPLAALAVIAGSPAWAQNSAQSPSTAPQPPPAQQQPATSNAAIGTATISPTRIPPAQRNPLLTDGGDVRIGKMIGTDIYNSDDKKVGNVDGVVANGTGQLQVIINTNNKKVAVPWDKVQFGDARLNGDNKILMSDATQQSLNSLPIYQYQHSK